MKSVTRLHRSSAIQAYRELLVWDFHPLVIRAVRAHVVLQRRSGGLIRFGLNRNGSGRRWSRDDTSRRRSSSSACAGTCGMRSVCVTLRKSWPRNLTVDHVMIWRWVQRYAPELN